MKKLALIFVASAMVSSAFAVIYTDPTGDVAVPGNPFPHIDITSVEVTNTLSTITFKFNVAGDPVATNWGKYTIIGRKVGASTLDMSATNNPWGPRPYGLAGGSNFWIGSWADAPASNQQNWTYNGSWNLVSTVNNSVNTTSVTLTSTLADLGLAAGDNLMFDAVTTGGGGSDTAVDSLTGAPTTGWGDSVTLQGNRYLVTPEPATFAALGLGALAMLRRRKK